MTGKQILGTTMIALPFLATATYGAITSRSFAIALGVAIVFMACFYLGCKLWGDA